MVNKKSGLFIIIILFVFGGAPAFGYIDPGSGSMIIQILVAGLLSAGALFGIFRMKIKALFMRIFKRDKSQSTGNENSEKSTQAITADDENGPKKQ